jgi:hypothetical protein
MNVDAILEAFSQNEAEAILIGGMNFLLRHQPVLTFDVDLWVRDSDENLTRVTQSLRNLKAEWGRDDASWGPVQEGFQWLRQQTVFCFTTPYGALDIFREVAGLVDFEDCWARSAPKHTSAGIPFRSLSDDDMLACQLVLPEEQRRRDRVAYLQKLKEAND